MRAVPLYILGIICLVAVSFLAPGRFLSDQSLEGFATLNLRSDGAVLSPGQRVRVDIVVQDVQNLGGVQLDVRYNAAVLTYVGIQEGSFLKNGSATVFSNPAVSTGLLDNIVTARLSSGASGSGVLASIYFDAKTTGVANITVHNLLLASATGAPINSTSVGTTLSVVALDADKDGVPDDLDACPNTPASTKVDARGCTPFADADNDGVSDTLDLCPGTTAGVLVDATGCVPRGDADKDGVADGVDRCARTPSGTAVDVYGCPVVKDADGDGVVDSKDRCPGTPTGTRIDRNGCTRSRWRWWWR